MTHDIERRDFLHGVGLAAGAAAASTLIEKPAQAQAASQPGAKPTYQIKPFSLDPKSVKGISEKVLVSHYENNYVGAVKRLTAIAAQLAELDYSKAPGFVINGLKREELIAMNSMTCMRPISTASAVVELRAAFSRTRSRAISAASNAGARSFRPWARRKAAAPAGCC
jgi:hypothetical protein